MDSDMRALIYYYHKKFKQDGWKGKKKKKNTDKIETTLRVVYSVVTFSLSLCIYGYVVLLSLISSKTYAGVSVIFRSSS